MNTHAVGLLHSNVVGSPTAAVAGTGHGGSVWWGWGLALALNEAECAALPPVRPSRAEQLSSGLLAGVALGL